jgi:hypothetical protein
MTTTTRSTGSLVKLAGQAEERLGSSAAPFPMCSTLTTTAALPGHFMPDDDHVADDDDDDHDHFYPSSGFALRSRGDLSEQTQTPSRAFNDG